jgi:hypothetical protein
MSFIAQTVRGSTPSVGHPRSGIQMVDLDNGNWREIAERASAEENPTKMTLLVEQLCAELDREAALSPVAYRERMNEAPCRSLR